MKNEYEGMQLWEVIGNRAHITISDTAEDMWKRACEYFLWCDENPVTWKSTIMSGSKGGSKVENESPRPYSVRAMCIFCGLSESYISSIRNSKDQQSDYYIVISKILSIIYVQNLDYATAGVFNPIFTSKLLNLGEEDNGTLEPAKVQIITDGIPTLSSSENEVLQKLEMEKSFSQLDKEQKVKKQNA